jgi:transcriptional regulator with GAF, ATPase, and Fis domain
MENPGVWFRFAGLNRSLEREVRSELSSAGIQLASCDSAACPYGILCFDQVSDEVFSILHGVRCRAQCRVLALAAPDCTDAAVVWRLLHAGAADALVWSEDARAVEQIRAKLDRWRLIDKLLVEETGRGSIIGDSPSWRNLVREVIEASLFTTAPILLAGESGTGKELLAQLVNSVSQRNGTRREPGRDIVTVDCAAIVPELSGSEFFGHERGAFTGAQTQREGAFALANGATLFLDEIGEVPLALQAQLLRAIQEKTYRRVGGNSWQTSNFRLVCATNRDLDELVKEGQFRLDLYYRIAGCVFRTPRLSERVEDIVPLASYFLCELFPHDTPEFDNSVRDYLVNRPYAGNVRALRQLIQRIAYRHAGPGPITPGDIPEEDRPCDGKLSRGWPNQQLEQSIADAIAMGTSLKEMSQMATETAIRIAVQSEEGNLQRAARRLGITDRALQIRRAAAKGSGMGIAARRHD